MSKEIARESVEEKSLTDQPSPTEPEGERSPGSSPGLHADVQPGRRTLVNARHGRRVIG